MSFFQGVKSGEILLSSEILASGRDPSEKTRGGQRKPIIGKIVFFLNKKYYFLKFQQLALIKYVLSSKIKIFIEVHWCLIY